MENLKPIKQYVVREHVVKLTIYRKDIHNTLSYISLNEISERIKIDRSSIFITDMEGQLIPVKKHNGDFYITIDPPIFDSISVLVYFNSK